MIFILGFFILMIVYTLVDYNLEVKRQQKRQEERYKSILNYIKKEPQLRIIKCIL